MAGRRGAPRLFGFGDLRAGFCSFPGWNISKPPGSYILILCGSPWFFFGAVLLPEICEFTLL